MQIENGLAERTKTSRNHELPSGYETLEACCYLDFFFFLILILATVYFPHLETWKSLFSLKFPVWHQQLLAIIFINISADISREIWLQLRSE